MEPNDFSVTSGSNIRDLRRARDWSAEYLARRIGISGDSMRKYERGERPLPGELIRDIAVALDAHIMSIYRGTDPREPASDSSEDYRVLPPEDSSVLRRLASEWDGDVHALIIANALYSIFPPSGRLEIMMLIMILKDKYLRDGTITPDQLPTGMSYLEERIGGLCQL